MQPLLLFALFLSATITAFKIDASCSAADADLIRSATLQAVDMANKALDALDKTPRDDDVNRLVKLLFCQDGEDPDTVDLFDVREALKGVEVLGNENPRADVEDSMNDVVIYCGVSRLQKNERGEWVDTAINKVIHDYEGECTAFDMTLAYTWNPRWITWENGVDAAGNVRIASRKHASQITICPWLLQWAHNAPYKTWRDVVSKASLAKWAIGFLSRGWPMTPIDAASLVDKVMLHEMTHTYAGGELKDVSEGFERWWPFRAAYGWRAATRLAKMDRTAGENRAVTNSDTVALFASAIQKLSQSPPIYVRDDGALTKEII